MRTRQRCGLFFLLFLAVSVSNSLGHKIRRVKRSEYPLRLITLDALSRARGKERNNTTETDIERSVHADNTKKTYFGSPLTTEKGNSEDSAHAAKKRKLHSMYPLFEAELGSRVLSQPTLAWMNGGGTIDQQDQRIGIIASTYSRYIEVLETNGDDFPSWPFVLEQSIFKASPLRYDIDNDGHFETAITTVNGEIIFLRDTGEPMDGYSIRIPKLPVPKHWYKTQPTPTEKESSKTNRASSSRGKIGSQATEKEFIARRDLLESKNHEHISGFDGDLSPSGKHAINELVHDEQNVEDEMSGHGTGGENGRKDDEYGIDEDEYYYFEDIDSKMKREIHGFLYSKLYDDVMHDLRKSPRYEDQVLIDAHVLATPVIWDVDSDGHDELIVPVSYFFDSSEFIDPSKWEELAVDVDLDMYHASGIVVIDLEDYTIKWAVHLDLTTGRDKHVSMIEGPPIIVDLNGDGYWDVIVGTVHGFIYALRGSDGSSVLGFPVWLDGLRGHVLVDDVNQDGAIEICAVDRHTKVACFDLMGEEMWTQNLESIPAQAPICADINGDGIRDLVFPTRSHEIIVLSAEDGAVVPGFPINLDSVLIARPLVLPKTKKSLAHFIIVPSTNGYLFLIDGENPSSVSHVLVGSPSLLTPLCADLSGNKKLDLIVSTLDGVFSFGTDIKYHRSMKRWKESNTFVSYGNTHGVKFRSIRGQAADHNVYDVMGQTFKIHFEITDKRFHAVKREKKDDGVTLAIEKQDHTFVPMYHIEISIAGRDILYESVKRTYGKYAVKLMCPRTPLSTVLVIRMRNEAGMIFEDEMPIRFHANVHNAIKWFVVIPGLTICAMILALVRHRTPVLD
eukprot:TRINITY_DN4051_c0_g1_i1.p1 TRINITY_DN4051_c0_g1~~TRINITY_DN4051_c0_g1_i1.p1  ORF type:complete len:846 (-),score=219.03 TRINITY_DN4051_c0_g1_i1:71-2608(-)